MDKGKYQWHPIITIHAIDVHDTSMFHTLCYLFHNRVSKFKLSVDRIRVDTPRLTITLTTDGRAPITLTTDGLAPIILTTDGLAPVGDVSELALQLSSAVPATVELHERAHCVIVATNSEML